ncbi:adenylate/guanylate cyclase domain-containing protein [Bradyrhizobium sp.]|uniref:adenylate/guanylate cyclase domain-containing protein n=1 Tax=Bradyrhizobium sp. TaxID=376 RepID=UPI00272FA70E|nr:adenylate/guanylate cyclase domain-containing protein [Bradyrhizobium sp.]
MVTKRRNLPGELARRCSHCGFEIRPTANFCGGCGRSRAIGTATDHNALTFLQSKVPPQLAERILHSGGAMFGERKHVTVLFADIRGSTALIDRLDPEEALEMLGPVLQVLMDVIHQHDGFMNQARGDGVMALFGAPIATEDHAVQACRAAIAMQASIHELNRRKTSDISLRVGINSGHVVVHSIGSNLIMNYDAVGKTVHLAARMEELAAPNGIMLTAATQRLAKGFIVAEPRGTVELKGVAEPVEAFELGGMRSTTRWQARSSQGLNVLVGRQGELDTLRGLLRRAAGGNGQAVNVVGAAGFGKSRLIHDFVGELPSEWMVLETACVSQHIQSSYYPISDLIRHMFGIDIDDTPDTVARRIKEQIVSLDPTLSTYLPAISSVLDISVEDQAWKNLEPTEKRREIVEAITALILFQERRTPLLIIVEDVHWIDSETRIILHNILSLLRGLRIFLVMTQRPEGNLADPDLLRLELSALAEVASQEMLDRLIGRDVTLQSIRSRIVAKAQGNPLFLEELVQSLAETGSFEGEPGDYRLSKPAGRIEIPQTIHTVLAARIDRLDGLPKTLLQTAAVVGADVSIALLSGMLEVPASKISGHLKQLEEADFLRRVKRVGSEYSFKHELIREVAYGTMLLGTRRSLHAKAVATIESLFGDRLDEHIDRLADHAFLAGLWEKAAPYQLRSCRRAVRRGANQDAIGIYHRGLETLSHWPVSAAKIRAEIDFRLIVVIALEPLGKHRLIADVLREARELDDPSNDPIRNAAVNCQLAVALWRIGEHDHAMEAAKAASNIAQRIGDPALNFASLHHIGMVLRETGAYRDSIEMHEKCFAFESPELDARRAGWAAYPTVMVRTFLADSLIEIGELERAEVMADEAIRRAEDHFYSRQNISHVLARLRIAQGRHVEALSILRECWQTCLERGIVQMYPILAARMGEAYLALGDIKAATEILAKPERLDMPLGENAFGWGWLFVTQGRAFLAVGDHPQARISGQRALALAVERSEPPQQAYALKLLGDIYLAKGDWSEAQSYLERSLEIATRCDMRPLIDQCHSVLDRASRAL